ncbi:MAG: glycoside hydrolase domain-containing protein [Armatimonadota bacterium]
MRVPWCIAALVTMAASACVAGPRVGVPPATAPPTIDGLAAPGEWDRAATFPCWQDNTNRAPAQRPMWVCLQYDAAHLYALMQSAAAPGVMAACLLPGAAQRAVAVIAQFGSEVRFEGDDSGAWAGRSTVASAVADGTWTVELAAPLELLGIAADGPASVPADFVREWTDPAAQVSWAWRMARDLTVADPAEMGVLSLDAEGPVARAGEPGELAGGTLDCAIDVIGLQDDPEIVTLYYDTVASGQKWRHAALPVSVAAGQTDTLHARRTIRGPQASAQVDEVALWVTTRAFRRVQYASGRLPVERWPAIAALPLDFIGTEVLATHYDLSGLPLGSFGESTVACTLLSADGMVRALAQAAANARQVSLTLPVADLPPGEYAVRAEARGAGGQTLGQTAQTLIIPDPSPWLGNAIGLTETVPEPFTPLAIDGRAVRCWGREYTFGSSGLPAQVVSQGETLLAGPVQLELVAAGRLVAWEGGPRLRIDGRDVRGRARGAAGDTRVECLTTVEYDGMMCFDLTLTPQRTTTLDRLVLRIPFAPEHATYLIWTDCAGTGSPADERYGALPEGGWEADFLPFVWLGDEDRGMVWFCEGPVGWSAPPRRKPLSVARQGEAVVMQIAMVEAQRRIDGPITYTFGLQAGPVRPRPDDWRHWTARIAPIATDDAWFGVVPTNLRERPDLIARQRERGNPLLVYTFLGETATNQPEYVYFADRWTRAASTGPISYTHAPVCPGSSFLDFQLWNFRQGLEEFGIDGLYYDLAWPGPCSNQSHGHGFIDEAGELRPIYPIFAFRELAKRTYQMFHEARPGSHIMAHISGNAICLPITAFADHTLDGEQYAQTVQGDYIDLIPLDKMRAQFTARQFGPIPHFLPELWRRGDHLEPGPTVNMCALTFLHDSLVFPAFHHGGARQQLDQVWEAFGVTEGAQFVPYWANRRAIERTPAGVEVSAWLRPGGALLAVANLGADAAEAALTVDWQALGLAGEVTITDGVTGEAIARDDGRLTVALEGKSLRMVVARQAEEE